MKAVLDEGVPDDIVFPLRRLGADVDLFRREWRGLANGRLIAAVEQAGYTHLITNDKNMGFQLNLRTLRIAIVALPTNLASMLLNRVDDICDTLGRVQRGQAAMIDLDGRRIARSADLTGATVFLELPAVSPFRR